MPPTPPDLQSAIENAYAVFADYRIGRDVDFAARVGLSAAEHDRLKAMLIETQLRELSAVAIDAYLEYVCAAYYDGAFRADELRYFLPRALDLIASRDRGTADLLFYLDLIVERGTVRSVWPVAEVEAIDRVLALSSEA